jgi:serine/threonine-protein kinase RsbW
VPGPPDDAARPLEVWLTIPADARYIRLARLTAAGIASDLGFTLQGLEDLRVGIDEVCAVVIEGCDDPEAILALQYQADGDGLEVRGTCSWGAHADPELHPVAAELLALVAQTYGVRRTEVGREFHLRTRSQDLLT